MFFFFIHTAWQSHIHCQVTTVWASDRDGSCEEAGSPFFLTAVVKKNKKKRINRGEIFILQVPPADFISLSQWSPSIPIFLDYRLQWGISSGRSVSLSSAPLPPSSDLQQQVRLQPEEAASSAASSTVTPSESAAIGVPPGSYSCKWMRAWYCVCVSVRNVTCFVCLSEGVHSTRRLQLCCSVLDSMGGAESYSVSVSCVGSPASVHGLDNVPAPQSQKNLEHITHKGCKHLEQNLSKYLFFFLNGDWLKKVRHKT